MYEWSLDSLYESFNGKYENDINTLKSLTSDMITLSNNLFCLNDLENWYALDTEFSILATKLIGFTTLTLSTNTTNEIASKWMTTLQPLLSNTTEAYSLYKKFIIDNKHNVSDWISSSEVVKDQEYNINEILKNAEFLLSSEVEGVISKLKINASNTWSKLQSHLTSLATVDFKGETITLAALRNLAYSPDQEIRKEAYETEIKLYSTIEDAVAFSLNSIKGEVNVINEMRGFESPIQKTLIDSRMSQKTLDALISAIENYLPVFRKYFKHKAKLLGHTSGLPWYDLFAPFETSNPRSYSVDDSKKIIVSSFATFSKELSSMAEEAYDNNWIDFYPREGKRGGAFCSNLAPIKQSRILTNYGESISDIITLAHELGHAFHGMQIEDLSILNTDYTMPVAETASTFCENIVFNAAIESVGEEEKLVLIENSISDLAQITVDILSRYKFETEVFERRKHQFLFPDDLKEIMTQAQNDTYGDGLDQNTMHPYMWINKGHYYSGGLSFYNFPYAFGGLFALGLYSQYKKEGESFIPKYNNLLKATTTASCEDVAALANIDVQDVSFWESSLRIVEERIDDFIELTSK